MEPEGNLLIEGDNLAAASLLLSRAEAKVDLIYLDPPFATELDFKAGDEAAYGDRWGSLAAYVSFLQARLFLCHRLLSPGGSLYLHLDYRRVHHARVLLDQIFGERCMRNEIIWHYQSGGRSRRSFAFKHDTILVYGRTPDSFFDGDAVKVPRAGKNHMKRGVDEQGRSFRSIRSAGKEYRYYDDDGVIPDDVWSDISHLQQRDPERTGYPTQKPEKLLERVVRASSPAGGLVADLFCGSGTTLAVAQRLGRRWLGCDAGALALDTTRKRLSALGAVFEQVRV